MRVMSNAGERLMSVICQPKAQMLIEGVEESPILQHLFFNHRYDK